MIRGEASYCVEREQLGFPAESRGDEAGKISWIMETLEHEGGSVACEAVLEQSHERLHVTYCFSSISDGVNGFIQSKWNEYR